MNLTTFHQQFPDEQSCIDYFKEQRLASGMSCSNCGKIHFKFATGKRRFYCTHCNKSISLKSGTVMEQSNLSFKTWLFCIKYMTMTKKGVSAKEMQRMLGMKRYEPVWFMMHKLRSVMGKRDDLYNLSESIEIDEGFFERLSEEVGSEGNSTNDSEKKEKRGRGSKKQAKVLVMAESKQVEDVDEKYKHKTDKKVGFIKIKLMSDLSSHSINEIVSEQVEQGTEVLSDGYKGYNSLKKIIKKHNVLIETDKHIASKKFPWVNRTISNAKKVLLGIHHNVINEQYIQNYLNEFCYKFNRRYFEDKLTDRLVVAGLTNTWYG